MRRNAARDGVNLTGLDLKGRLQGYGWIAPALVVLILVDGYPFIYATWLSLYKKGLLDAEATFVGLDNYVGQLSDGAFWHSVWVGIVFAVASVATQLLVGMVLSLLLHREFRGRGIARALALLPYMIPTASVALVFAFMFNNVYGIFNHLLISAGLIDAPLSFFSSTSWAMPTTVLVGVWKWTPFVIIVLLARLQTIDGQLYEGAQVEGAGPVRQFFDITLPSLRGAILLIVLLRTIWMFNKFDIPYLLTSGGPLEATTNLPIYTYEVVFQRFEQGAGNALAVLMFLLLMCFAIPYVMLVRPEQEVSTQ